MADTPRIEELKRRVQSDPASIAFAALAEEYRRAGRFDEAISTCITGLQRHPSYLSAHVTLGRALIEVGRYDDAREELELVLRAAPENLAAIRGLAEIHHRLGDHPESQGAAPALETQLPSAPAPEPRPATAPSSPSDGPVGAGPVEFGVGSLEFGVGRLELGVDPPSPPPSDPVLEGLESFLAAIERARHAGAAAGV